MKALLPFIFACAGLVSSALVVIFELTRTPKQEADTIKREDEALPKVPDDPREMARWVPWVVPFLDPWAPTLEPSFRQ